VGWLPDGPKYRNEHCTNADEDGADQGVSRESFPKDKGCEDGVENEAGLDMSN
jgi:hypothetical protein